MQNLKSPMHPVYINGIGIISPAVASATELLTLAEQVKNGDNLTKKIDFSVPVNFDVTVAPQKIRRAPRYVKMTVQAVNLAWEDSGLTKEDAEDTGTIFVTGYGSLESNIAFTETVLKGVPFLARPIQFSYTVPNSCLGQTCMAFGYKGYSTMFLGGDPIEYSALLISEKKANNVICGAIDEWNEDLRISIGAAGQISGEKATDGASMLVLSAKENDKTYCRITAFSSVGLSVYPYIKSIEENEREEVLSDMVETLTELSEDFLPNVILTTANGSDFDELEKKAISLAFGENILQIEPKCFFGESFAAGYFENAALGAAMIKHEKLQGKNEIRYIIATGIDVHGNYLAVRLEA